MGILIARRQLIGNCFDYGLANYFAATLPQPPRFDVPEPAPHLMYPELNETSSDESDKEGE